MAKPTSPLLPATERLLAAFGERLRAARLRRRLTAKQVAERAGMTVVTLRALEHGSPGVTLRAYASVMQTLRLEGDFEQLASDDRVGRALQDASQPGPRRAPAAAPEATPPRQGKPAAKTARKKTSSPKTQSPSLSSGALAKLLK